MKIKTLLLTALLATGTAAHADEGMWTLFDLPKPVFEQMQGYGFALPYENLYSSSDAIKNAVVNFSGYCSWTKQQSSFPRRAAAAGLPTISASSAGH